MLRSCARPARRRPTCCAGACVLLRPLRCAACSCRNPLSRRPRRCLRSSTAALALLMRACGSEPCAAHSSSGGLCAYRRPSAGAVDAIRPDRSDCTLQGMPMPLIVGLWRRAWRCATIVSIHPRRSPSSMPWSPSARRLLAVIAPPDARRHRLPGAHHHRLQRRQRANHDRQRQRRRLQLEAAGPQGAAVRR